MTTNACIELRELETRALLDLAPQPVAEGAEEREPIVPADHLARVVGGEAVAVNCVKPVKEKKLRKK